MANRYWRGGTGTWDSTTTTNWSTTSGGVGGASVPTAADDVFFDVNSNVGTGAFTVTLANVARVCRNITISGLDGTMTLAGTAIGLTVSGSLSFPATNFTRTYTGTTTFNSTTTGNTITTNGVSFGNVTFNGVGGEWTLGSALTVSAGSTTTLSNGTLNLGGFTLSTGIFASTSSNIRAINFGTANIALTSTIALTTVLSMATATNFTWTGTGGFTRNQNSSSTVSFGSTAGGTLSNAPNFSVTTGIQTLTVTNDSWFKNLNLTGSTCNISGVANIAGVLTLGNPTTYSTFTPTFRVTTTFNTSGLTFSGFGVNGTGITVTLLSNVTCTTTGTVILTEGTLDLNGFNISVGSFFSSGTAVRVLSLGANNITLTGGAATTIIACAIATNFTWTGTGGFIRNQSSTATVNFGTTGGTTSNAPNLTVNAGASNLTITSNSWFKNLDFTGSTCTVTNTVNIAGVLTLATGGTYTSLIPVFRATTTFDSLGKIISGFGVNGTGITVTLTGTVTCSTTGTLTLTEGTLNLNGFDVSVGIFSSSVSTARSVSFGSNNINLTSTVAGTTVLSCGTATNFSWTGTGGFVRNQAATATVGFGGNSGGSVSNAPNLTVNAGASTLTINVSSFFKNLNFTGSTCAVVQNAVGTVNIVGNLTLDAGGTYTGLTPTFVSASTLTSTGKTLGSSTLNASGGSLTLADAMSVSAFTITNGTLFLSGFSLTSTGSFSTSLGTKNITFDGGTIVVSNATTTAWNNANPTGFTTTAGTGVGTISMTAATAKTFVGGGSTYNCTLNQGGAGTLTITGSNTFNDITNTTQPATVLFTAGTTNTFNNFSLSGTSGNLITIGSVTAASHTLSKAGGTVSVSFCSISYSNATGGASWQSYTSNGNVDGGNNTGWVFSAAVIYDVSISEDITASDTSSEFLIFIEDFSESVTGIDTSERILTKLGDLSETGAITDSPSSLLTKLTDLSESGAITDSAASVLTMVRSFEDSANPQDSLSINKDISRGFSEAAEVIDATDRTSTFEEAVNEQSQALADVNRVSTLSRDALAQITALDSLISVEEFSRSLSESAEITIPSLTYSLTVVFPVEESASTLDQTTVFSLIRNTLISDFASAVDASSFVYTSFPVQISETATILDSSVFAYARIPVQISESASAFDSSSFVYTSFPVQISESASAVDSSVFIYTSFPVQISETLSAIDTVSSVRQLAVTVSQTAEVVDAATESLIFVKAAEEIFSIYDAVEWRSALYSVDIVENVATLDVFESRSGTYSVAISETANVLDSVQFRAAVQPVQIVENVIALDQVSSALRWVIVPDAQTPDWQNLDPSQGGTWTVVNDAQTENWQEVNDAQAVMWANVNDSQSVTWQDINTA